MDKFALSHHITFGQRADLLWIPKTQSGLKIQVLAPFVRSSSSTMTPFFIALLALVTSTFRTRARRAKILNRPSGGVVLPEALTHCGGSFSMMELRHTRFHPLRPTL